RRACRADNLVAHRIDGPDVVDDPVGEIDRQLLASREHVLDALVRSVAAREELAAEKETLAGAPGSDLCAVEPIELHAARLCIRGPRDGGPIAELRCFELRGPRAVEHEVRMARRGAIR